MEFNRRRCDNLWPHRFAASQTGMPTLEGSSLFFEGNVEAGISVQGKTIVKTDLLGTNGVVHYVEGLLYPAELAQCA